MKMSNNLPPSVQAQASKSEELIENLNSPTQQESVVEEPKPVPQVEEPKPPVMDEPTPPVTEEEVKPRIQTTPTNDSSEELRKAEARNASLQGIAEANGKMIKEQNAKIAELKAQLAEANKKPVAPKDYAKEVFTEEDIENLGEEYTDAMARLVNKAVAEERETIRHELMNELGMVKDTVAQSQENAFWNSIMGRLGISGKELEDLDNSSEFNQWLTQPDGMSGQTLDQSLRQAIGRNDIEATSKFYESFKANQGKESVPAPKKTITTTGSETVQAQIDPGNQKTYSLREYQDVVSKWTSGRLRGWTKDQFDKYCLEVDKAHMEGRITA